MCDGLSHRAHQTIGGACQGGLLSAGELGAEGPNMTETTKILLVDDEADTLLPLLAMWLEPRGFEISGLAEPRRTQQVISNLQPDLVLLDLHFPGDDLLRDGSTTGGRLLGEIRQAFPNLPVMLFTTTLDDLDRPVEGFREQPHARFAKPDFGRQRGWAESLDREMLEAISAAAFAREHAQEALGFVVGDTPAMAEVARQVRLAAGNRLGVLIYGEPGTGKHTTALAIHRLSGRRGPFIKLDCAAGDPATLEAQLFGTPAADVVESSARQPGLLEQAQHGTLFLNQIHRLPLPVQDRLKAFIDSGGTLPAAAGGPGMPLDVRFIAASQHDLAALADDDYLLPDLGYRIAVTLVALPPLRDRLVDLPELFAVLLEKACSQLGRNLLPTLRPETLERLQGHTWPGNVRELESTLLRAVASTTSNVLLPESVVFSPLSHVQRRPGSPSPIPSTEMEQVGHKLDVELEEDLVQLREAAAGLVSRIWALPINQRYQVVLDTQGALRKELLTEFVRQLHEKQRRKVRHKDLLGELDPIAEAAEVPPDEWKRALDRVRQTINKSIHLTDLDFNQ
jgi:DNA-binding NtrC family response regulator